MGWIGRTGMVRGMAATAFVVAAWAFAPGLASAQRTYTFAAYQVQAVATDSAVTTCSVPVVAEAAAASVTWTCTETGEPSGAPYSVPVEASKVAHEVIAQRDQLGCPAEILRRKVFLQT